MIKLQQKQYLYARQKADCRIIKLFAKVQKRLGENKILAGANSITYTPPTLHSFGDAREFSV
jgi:hypothetical protein